MGPLEIKFLVILGILIGLKQANAIKCYECSLLDSNCNDPFNPTGVKTIDCQFSCTKLKQSKNSPAAERGCHDNCMDGDVCGEGTFKQMTGMFCSCKGNLCNYALPVGSSIMLMAFAMIVYIVLR